MCWSGCGDQSYSSTGRPPTAEDAEPQSSGKKKSACDSACVGGAVGGGIVLLLGVLLLVKYQRLSCPGAAPEPADTKKVAGLVECKEKPLGTSELEGAITASEATGS